MTPKERAQKLCESVRALIWGIYDEKALTTVENTIKEATAELQAKLDQAERDVKEVQAAREWIANKTGVGGGLRPLSFLISSHEYMAQERAAAWAQQHAAESALAAA